MTMPPRAAKFRIRRGAAAVPSSPSPSPEDRPDEHSAAASHDTAEATAIPPAGAAPADAIAAIQAENLTGRQLRTARRIAQRHGLSASSDLEAVHFLRRKGIDPFDPSALLAIVGQARQADEKIQLPQTVAPARNLPAQPLGEAERAREIIAIQRDIVRRRRRNLLRLLARLAAFVLFPTLLAGAYYAVVATPLYATKSEFVIQQAENPASGIGSMFRGTQFATSQDSIAVQGYLQSRDAMLRLDKDLGFKAHFSEPGIDPVQRLDPAASNEQAYRLYRRNVKIGYDPTEGIIKMEVIAADPALSQRFAEALISYAEEQVDNLSSRLREDQMEGARASFEAAEARVLGAQEKVLDLQQALGVLDPMSESNAAMSQISSFEVQLQTKRLELSQLLDNASPNRARVDGAKGDIARLEALIANLRSQLTQGSAGTASLAQVTGQLRIAEADLETRQMMLSQALQQLENARIEANRQVRYLETSVSPVAPDEPTYPRTFENTLLAFLIFGGIYLMVSLTASILKEQATS